MVLLLLRSQYKLSEISIVFGLAFVLVFYYVYTKDLLNKPSDSMNKQIFSYLRVKDLAVFMHMLGGFFLLGFMGVLLILSNGQSYEGAVETFFIASAWLVSGVFFLYLGIYIIFRIKEELTNAVKPFSKRR